MLFPIVFSDISSELCLLFQSWIAFLLLYIFLQNLPYILINALYFVVLVCWHWHVHLNNKCLVFKVVAKILVTRRKTAGLDNPDRFKYIVQSLFPHVKPFQRQDWSSCVVRREELFTLEKIRRADGRLKANTAPGISGVPNEIPIFLSSGGDILRRLEEAEVGPVEEGQQTSVGCLSDTMGKLLEEMILQRLQGHMVRENGLSENQFGFRKVKSTVEDIQAVVDIATKARRGTGKRKGFCALISIDVRNAFNTAR